jgi:hypothetical protein
LYLCNRITQKNNFKDMKKYIFFFFLLIGLNQLVNAQVKIGGDITTKADPSAVLELASTTGGLLIPRVAATSNVAGPAKGLLIYNTTLNALQVNVGTSAAPQWMSVSVVSASPAPARPVQAVVEDSVVSQGTNSGAIVVPVGTSTQRPATPVVGMIRFNTDTGNFEGYNGTAWVVLSK